MVRRTIPIKGMHCRSCVLLVEDALSEVAGVTKVRVSYRRRAAVIESSKPLGLGKIKRALASAGYEMGTDESRTWLSKDPAEYRDLGAAVLIIAILFILARALGLSRITSSFGEPSGLLIALLVGLTAGVSSCMALVGGLVLGVSARHAEKHPEATPLQKFRPHLFFNIGRIASYFLAGGLIGLFGKTFQLSGTVLGTMTIAVGAFMLLLGLRLTEISPRVSAMSLTLPSIGGRRVGKAGRSSEYSHTDSLLLGALTIFLPCGFTQAMQLYALASGSFWTGSAILGLFALGTTPGLLGVGGLTALLKGAPARKFFKFAGVLVVLLAFVNISNGLNLTGWKSFFLPGDTASVAENDPNVTLVEGVQEVRMAQTASGYSPNTFTIRQGIPVRWVIDSKTTSSCASSLISSKIGVRRNLRKGENIIEFTPQETGQIRFSCSMGMYTGAFNVIADPTTPAGESAREAV
jgi:sulfite exporter TauE/SafE/copper chaperone CopZ